VNLHKTEVAAEAAVGQGSVKVLREMLTDKKQKMLLQYVCSCSATMLTSKIITESVENHSECRECVNSRNKLVSTRSCSPWNSLWYYNEKLAPPSLPPFSKNRGRNATTLPASLRVIEKYTIVTIILNAIAHLQS